MTIDVVDLAIRAGRERLLTEVSFSVPTGSWCTVIGPNGAGKTTLLSAMAGLRTPTHGTVLVDGQAVLPLSERARARVLAYVPQSPIIPIGMNVADFVLLGRTAAHGILRAPSASDRALVDGVVDRLSLGDLRQRDMATLSGGEQQRAVLARTLAQGTRVVLVDEPTTGLDVRHQMETLELLKKEVDECQLTVVATLHDLTIAGLFADHMVLLSGGRLVSQATPHEVLRSEALSQSYGTSLRVVTVDGRDVVIPNRFER